MQNEGITKMTKREIVVKISEETGFIQADVAIIVQKVIDNLADELAQGRTIELRDFGVFEVNVRKQRKGRNPNRPQDEYIIPQRVLVRFRAGKELKERVEKLNPKKVK